MTPDPKIALLVFFGIVIIILVLVRTGILSRNFTNRKDTKRTEVEDILKQLYHVEYSGRKATLNGMSGALKMNYGKLVDLIEYMASLEFIKVDNNLIELTPAGSDYALKIIRTHRLWEKYLSEKTGIHKSEWHQRAEIMEHSLSADEAEELYKQLGSPRFDPHGDPIPLKSGEILDTIGKALSGAKPKTLARITHIEDEPEVIYKQIIDKKLHIGQQIKILDGDDNVVKFQSEGQQYELSTIIASNIGITALNEEEEFEELKVRLSSLDEGEKATIVGISRECRGASRRRLLDLGFIKGTTIENELNGPLQEPKAYLIKNTLIALRNDQADLILIEKM